ncbi:hypothetical protein ACLI09_01285 [Flavobacterium sp. RHBU_24]|uniref:hypothetical protein n=1 Tax=Flavobacterium sp. RHBU_24 TaxID=3391185 RepID=UPI0039852340
MKKIILLALFTTTFLHAQTEDKTSSRIKVYTPTGLQHETAASETYKWAVKTDLFSFIGGEFPIIGEYRIAKKFSVEASAGVTFAFLPNEDIFGMDDDGSFDSKAAMGSAFRGGFKFYPSSDYDAIEGWAFGVQLFSKTTNREYEQNDYDDFSSALEGEKDTKVKTGFALTISKQVFWDSNISVEYLLGIGFASVKHDYVNQGEYIYDENTGIGFYEIEKESKKETVPNLQLGLRLGFGN